VIRRRDFRPSWLAVLAVVAGIVLATVGAGLAGGVDDSSGNGGPVTRPAAAVTLASTAVEAAVVPARSEAGARSGVHQSPGRSLLPLVAALVAIVGLLGATGRRTDPPLAGGQPLRARRHAIALRAPPPPQLV
jgi:hypothetical protein